MARQKNFSELIASAVPDKEDAKILQNLIVGFGNPSPCYVDKALEIIQSVPNIKKREKILVIFLTKLAENSRNLGRAVLSAESSDKTKLSALVNLANIYKYIQQLVASDKLPEQLQSIWQSLLVKANDPDWRLGVYRCEMQKEPCTL